jgi:hypothetical protein
MVSATQDVPVNVYLVDLMLPFGATEFIMHGTQVIEFSAESGSRIQMLLGMDIIRQGVLTMSFDGHFTFCI